MNARAGRLEIRELVKHYGGDGPAAVAGIDLTIDPGEFITLLGPSGSGKTTTLNMIAGFVPPTSGSILLGGTDLTGLQPHKRGFGMVFQNYALFPHMSVFDNVAYPLRQRGKSKAEIRKLVLDIVERFGLAGLERRRPAQLSGGQQQRVALARALVFSPPVLLLDEPLGALDRKLRAQLQLELKKLHQEVGLTFVFVTHDQDEAMYLSDRIAVFDEGRIDGMGRPAELYDDPGTLFVANFLGEANTFAGRFADPRTYAWNDEKWRTGEGDHPAEAVLVVRPERTRVFAPGEVPPGWNSVGAIVTDVSRLGPTSRIDLAFPDGRAGAAVLPSTDAVQVRVGDDVRAAWDLPSQAFVTP
ncbi:putative spermidine/putrescine transport system ATP-binding protein [Pseudonocardia thermophila]|uniref:ABC-type quaternary amine transporter n=1 Tax=Pseudonocardia thermophila TaxID=1848 RepID=A0A1M6ZMS1_PSETH|nr:ABC transporter ATP-binding protein [Pseudonocardia thermophila]SHL31772.1 putative spermidine/putrescine transport system ATP-binding protein [Pseudonocardia thermophila]